MFPMVIEERVAPKRTIVLRGRSLPYTGVAWGGNQRVNLSWFPGVPVATAQVIGPTMKPTEVRGEWKDRFLFEDRSAVTLLNFPKLSPSALPGSPRTGNTFISSASVPGQAEARRAEVVRDAMEMIARGGSRVRVEWGSLARFGFITEWEFTHRRPEDIIWSLEFSWIGDAEFSSRPRTRPSLDALSGIKALLALLDKLLSAFLAALLRAQREIQAIDQIIKKIGSLTDEFISGLRGFIDLAFAPADTLALMQSTLNNIRLATRELLAETVQAIGFAQDLTIAPFNEMAAIMLAVRDAAQRLGVEAVLRGEEIEALLGGDVRGTVIARSGQTLRDISFQAFGTAANWLAIADFNGLASAAVPAGTVVRIPEV